MAGNWQADFERGVQLMQGGEYHEAREMLEKSLEQEPGQALTVYSLAVACAQDGAPERARELLRGLDAAGSITPAGRTLLEDLERKLSGAPAAAPAAPQGGLKLNFGAPAPAPAPEGGLKLNFGAPAPAAPQGGLKLNFGAPAPAAAPEGGLKLNFGAPAPQVQAIDVGNDPARMLSMLRSMEESGELTPTGRQMLNDLLAKHPELEGGVGGGVTPAAGGLRLNFASPAPAPAAAPEGGLKLNFGAPAPAPTAGGAPLNFGAALGQPGVLGPAFANRFGPGTVLRVANSPKTWKEILRFHGELGNEPELDRMYRECHAAWGDCWYYADAFTATYAAVRCAQAKNYLDLGTGHGHNLLAAIRACPAVNFIVCEDWDDAGLAAARDFALSLKGTGKGKFMQGRPPVMLPKMRAANPELRFDVITVAGLAGSDAEPVLSLAMPLLNPGGVLILGDFTRDPRLASVWRGALGGVGGFAAVEYCEAGSGVAVAVKIA